MALPFINQNDTIERMNRYGSSATPFFFLISYDASQNLVLRPEEMDAEEIRYDFQGIGNGVEREVSRTTPLYFEAQPMPFEAYQKGFDEVQAALHRGDTFLCNLTAPTPVRCNLTTRELFERSKARYRLWVKGHFTLFTPEIFVQIEEGVIRSFPMKGTLDASLPDAVSTLLADRKEQEEHATIVDLIRNDLSRVAHPVWVERYRYVEEIATASGGLLQVSSEICGELPLHFFNQLGSHFFQLLPAGSITGAPKPSTLRIIERAEGYERGFYTGVCGYFDGNRLDSGVMIRFIEERPEGLCFKSGGGITAKSNVMDEYQELIRKVYVAAD